ncbi:MAG: hypothetical protein IJ831_09335 [Spirochaetales bacterium]|nr:hypothetical protein [Spirochaetales bacterium]
MSKKESRIYLSKAESIRNKLGDADYCLGIDPGVGSIGIAAIKLDSFGERLFPTTIVYSGARVFKSSEGAAERRQKRGERNSHRHKRNRLRVLWKLLAEKDLMLPFSREEADDPATLRFDEETRKKDPYMLRLKGLREELSLFELGYALYHIANHRGTSSVRTISEMSDDKKYEAGKQKTFEIVRETKVKTFIEVIHKYNETLNSKVYRNKKDYENYTIPVPTRNLVENELDTLLDTQSSFHRNVLVPDYMSRIKEAVLSENEMLIPEPGNCPYFKNEKKLPSMAFINEERRIWEMLNNVRYSIIEADNSFSKNKMLSQDERSILFDELMTGKNISEAGFRKLLNLASATEIKLQGTTKKTQQLKGFRYPQLKANPFIRMMETSLQNDLFAKWVNSPSEEVFIDYVREQFGATEEEMSGLMKDLREEASAGIGTYAPCGQTAMEILLPYIRDERISFHEAVLAAIENGQLIDFAVERNLDALPYYGKILPDSAAMLMGKAWHSAFEEKVESAGFHKPSTNTDEENYGRIANPVVHQTLNELRKYVNELISILGKKPRYITIEVGRELKLGKEKREKLSRDNAKESKENKRIFDQYCKGVPNGNRLIKKFKLLERQKFICPYCLSKINVDDIKNGSVDYEHVFPESDIPGSPISNLVIAHNNCNEIKSKRIPFEAFGSTERWPGILQNISQNENMKPLFLEKFSMTREQYEQWKNTHGMLSRFATDNSYTATLIREYLSCLFSSDEVLHGAVRSVRGRETAILRKAWGLQGLSAELGNVHLSIEEQQEYQGEKVRADIRHHALDAIVIAYCTRGMVKKINTASGRSSSDDAIQEMIKIPIQFQDCNRPYELQKKEFSDSIRSVLFNETLCSRKIDHSTNGELLKGTNYSLYATNGKDVVFGVAKRVKNASPKTEKIEIKDSIYKSLCADYSIPKWVADKEREQLENYVAHNRMVYEQVCRHLGDAEEQLRKENDANTAAGKKALKIDDKAIAIRALNLSGGKYYEIKNSMISKLFIKKRTENSAMVIDTGSNYSIDFYHDKEGKLRAEVIRKIDIMDRSFSPQYRKKGYELFCRVFPYDVLEVDMQETVSGGKPESIFIPGSFFRRTYVVVTTFTLAANGNIQIYYDSILASRPGQKSSFYAESSMKQKHPRLIKLSPSGLVEYASPVLGDRECGE